MRRAPNRRQTGRTSLRRMRTAWQLPGARQRLVRDEKRLAECGRMRTLAHVRPQCPHRHDGADGQDKSHVVAFVLSGDRGRAARGRCKGQCTRAY
jgi:hypothetical protein